MSDDDGFIDLPPGFGDSGTHRVPRPERTVRRDNDEIAFIPVVHGVPVLPIATDTPAAEELATFTPPSAPEPEIEPADAGETRIVPSRHAAPTVRLTIPGFGQVTVDTALYLGRDPVTSGPGRAIAIADPAKSLSKTHALIEAEDLMLFVTDLDSTNGVWIAPDTGNPIEVLPGHRTEVPVGADLELGDVVIQVERG